MKTKRISLNFLSLIFCIFALSAQADGPAVQWQKTFGGSGNDWGYSVQQTFGGGFIIAGYTYSFGAGSSDVYLIKTDPKGNSLWQKTFGGSSGDYGCSVQLTSDGGFIIAGYTGSFGAGSSDVYLIKADPNGNLLWQKTFGGSNLDYGYSVQETNDGGFIITGQTNSSGDPNGNVYLIKTDPNGESQWQKTFGGSNYDAGFSIQQTSDGGFIIAGTTDSFGTGSSDLYLIKTEPNGNLLWQKSLGGDYGLSVQQTTDGGFIIAGSTGTFGAEGYADVHLVKTDPNGNLLWQKIFDRDYWDEGRSVLQTPDGGFIIAGFSGPGITDVYLIRTDSAGNLLWQETFGGISYDRGFSVQKTTDGGLIIAGSTDSFGAGHYDVYLIKLAGILGDLDYDGDVDNNDLALFKQKWLNTGCNAGNNWCGGADFDCDGNVDFVDFAFFAQHWLKGTSP